ncbi:hypothetical protein, partial [Pseudomonas aeruginosa]|uniref:hypothetical protein n=1 Tax=Pseudomonas aeruginosa TaxID=287 RepID=UPI001E5858F0
CRYTSLGQEELGSGLQNPAFVSELTRLINQGDWYFEEQESRDTAGSRLALPGVFYDSSSVKSCSIDLVG